MQPVDQNQNQMHAETRILRLVLVFAGASIFVHQPMNQDQLPKFCANFQNFLQNAMFFSAQSGPPLSMAQQNKSRQQLPSSLFPPASLTNPTADQLCAKNCALLLFLQVMDLGSLPLRDLSFSLSHNQLQDSMKSAQNRRGVHVPSMPPSTHGRLQGMVAVFCLNKVRRDGNKSKKEQEQTLSWLFHGDEKT